MVNYWDTSALVPLLIEEEDSQRREEELLTGGHITTWWGTLVECESALNRKNREGGLSVEAATLARDRLGKLSRQWREISAFYAVRRTAINLLARHSLRAADAMQLAAGLLATSGNAGESAFHCGDYRLAAAAKAEGFASAF